jgi:geranylgeranyl reductase family protein
VRGLADFDLIVVGGGPGGATTARRAALEGLNVLLLDKEEFPRYKACAGAIPNTCVELLDFPIDRVIHRRISGMAFFAPSGYRIDFVPEDRSHPGYTVMRDEFDSLLFEKAREAGVDDAQGAEVTEVTQNKKEVIIGTRDGEYFTGEYLVGADGVSSTVAKSLGFYDGWQSESVGVGIELEAKVTQEEVRRVCGDPSGYDADIFFLYFGYMPHGYTWCFPKRDVLSLGAWCRQDKVKAIREGYNRWFSKFKEDFQVEPYVYSDTAWRFPVVPSKTLVKGRTLLVGDAAGFVDAFTGEGVRYAIHSGIHAASVVKASIQSKDSRELQKYVGLCKKHILGDLDVSTYMANMFYKSHKNMETLSRFFRDDGYARDLMSALIGGLLPPKTVKRKMTMRMARKKPKDALSLLKG